MCCIGILVNRDLKFAEIISRAAVTFPLPPNIALAIKSGSAKSELRAGGFVL